MKLETRADLIDLLDDITAFGLQLDFAGNPDGEHIVEAAELVQQELDRYDSREASAIDTAQRIDGHLHTLRINLLMQMITGING